MDVCNVQFEFDTPVIPNRHDRDLAMYAGYILSPCLLSCRFFNRLPPSVARLLPLNVAARIADKKTRRNRSTRTPIVILWSASVRLATCLKDARLVGWLAISFYLE